MKLEQLAKEILKINREELLANREKTDLDTQTILTCTWHPKLRTLPQILHQHYYILENEMINHYQRYLITNQWYSFERKRVSIITLLKVISPYHKSTHLTLHYHAENADVQVTLSTKVQNYQYNQQQHYHHYLRRE